ncbi:retrovirus-related pol polyprotein from transposon TNT 1-94 [Tanacetum coccineum]
MKALALPTSRPFRELLNKMALLNDGTTLLLKLLGLLFLWAEAVATACYTQNRSLIHTLHDKTPYELVHDKKSDLLFLRVFRALCYPTNDSEDLGKLKAKADIGFFVGYAPNRQTAPVHSSPGPAPNLLTHGPISSGLVPNPPPAAPYVPPTNKELEILFQPMFDEYFESSTVDRLVPPAPAAQAPATLPVHQYPSPLIKRHHREVIHHHLRIINPLQYIKVLQLSIHLK